MKLLFAILVTFVASLALTAVVRAAARRFGIVARPRQDRWHSQPTVLLGGLGIFAAFAAGVGLFVPVDARLVPLLLGAMVISLVGLIDDLHGLKPFVRLVVQVAVAASVVYFGLELKWTTVPVVDNIITIFWMVGITNAINLLDNMDGLAGGITVICCAFLSITFALNGQADFALLPGVLAAAVAGFLVFNFHPASIFMGDCGSTFLGFTLGGMALLSTAGRSRSLAAVLVGPVLIFLIPIFDTTLVTVTRKLSGRPASQGGRDHMSHRLVAMGMSEVRAVLTLYALAAGSGLLALLTRLVNTESLFVLVPTATVLFVLLGIYLGKVRVYESDLAPATGTVIAALTDFSHKRRVFEILLDVVLVAIAYNAAYTLRFESGLPSAQAQILIRSLPLVLVSQMLFLLLGGVYNGIWRYAGLTELVAITRGAVIGVAASAALVFALFWARGPSRAVFILDLLLLIVLVSASRLLFRLIPLMLPPPRHANGGGTPILIYGAGDAGEILMRELRNNPSYNYVPVGFVDDDLRKSGREIHGCRIFPRSQLQELVRKHGIREIVISTAQVPEATLEELARMGIVTRKLSIRLE
jgi:UDP-GlcNAc:undecaprenyl-phosphate GlcNAc-1-phosphate transferase